MTTQIRNDAQIRKGHAEQDVKRAIAHHMCGAHVGLPGSVDTFKTSLVRNNDRYSAFPPNISPAFLEVSDLIGQILAKDL